MSFARLSGNKPVCIDVTNPREESVEAESSAVSKATRRLQGRPLDQIDGVPEAVIAAYAIRNADG
jgi:hypothetical protein